MDKQFCNLTVFFEDPFWVGVFEITSAGEMAVCKVTFGAEPKDYEIYDLMWVSKVSDDTIVGH